eukprot:gnl/Dysnectes_brevis/4767_a6567_547.p1 GENE.gnl/Dysnectes_brevis/4767_a6567_547~~gnl/Dysnectes_brevis/4767_a6567_547.p1  ORF type:complete len:1304 (+),score=120.51 gnl/Dysnectes_brevis/4767_a6567_547:144-3914(+)
MRRARGTPRPRGGGTATITDAGDTAGPYRIGTESTLAWLPEQGLYLLNIYWSSWTAADREVRAVKEAIRQYGERHPIIIAGDFNGNPAGRLGTERLVNGMNTKGLKQMPSRYTFRCAGGRTSTLDWILVHLPYPQKVTYKHVVHDPEALVDTRKRRHRVVTAILSLTTRPPLTEHKTLAHKTTSKILGEHLKRTANHYGAIQGRRAPITRLKTSEEDLAQAKEVTALAGLLADLTYQMRMIDVNPEALEKEATTPARWMQARSSIRDQVDRIWAAFIGDVNHAIDQHVEVKRRLPGAPIARRWVKRALEQGVESFVDLPESAKKGFEDWLKKGAQTTTLAQVLRPGKAQVAHWETLKAIKYHFGGNKGFAMDPEGSQAPPDGVQRANLIALGWSLIVSREEDRRKWINFTHEGLRGNPKEDRLPLSAEEVRNLIRRLPRRKSPGMDGIPNEVWRAIAENEKAGPELAKLFRTLLELGVMPSSMRDALMTGIPKGGEAKTYMHLRPISLLDSARRVLDKIALEVIKKSPLWMDGEMAKSGQFGGAGATSTTDALTVVMSAIAAGGKECTCLLIDLAKAFDQTDRTLALRELLKNTKLPPGLARWIAGALTDTHNVYMDPQSKLTSNPIATFSGVPQGGPLAPLLYVMAHGKLMRPADLPDEEYERVKVILGNAELMGAGVHQALRDAAQAMGYLVMYMDDTTIIAPNKKAAVGAAKRIKRALEERGQHLNEKKTVIAGLCGDKIFRLLGVTFDLKKDTKSQWSTHLGEVARKIAANTNNMVARGARSRLIPPIWGLTLHRSVTLGVAMYGMEVTWSAKTGARPAKSIHALTRNCGIFNFNQEISRSLRLLMVGEVSSGGRRVSVEATHIEAGLPPWWIMRLDRTIGFWIRTRRRVAKQQDKCDLFDRVFMAIVHLWSKALHNESHVWNPYRKMVKQVEKLSPHAIRALTIALLEPVWNRHQLILVGKMIRRLAIQDWVTKALRRGTELATMFRAQTELKKKQLTKKLTRRVLKGRPAAYIMKVRTSWATTVLRWRTTPDTYHTCKTCGQENQTRVHCTILCSSGEGGGPRRVAAVRAIQALDLLVQLIKEPGEITKALFLIARDLVDMTAISLPARLYRLLSVVADESEESASAYAVACGFFHEITLTGVRGGNTRYISEKLFPKLGTLWTREQSRLCMRNAREVIRRVNPNTAEWWPKLKEQWKIAKDMDALKPTPLGVIKDAPTETSQNGGAGLDFERELHTHDGSTRPAEEGRM